MVKFHEQTFTHSYPFPTVTLAYFLRYPNPYASHVLSTDVIDRYFDPISQTLYTARLHLKRSKLPKPLLKLLPRSWLGAAAPGEDGSSQTYILEKSVVAVKDGVMVTESRNLEFTGVLAVVERQLYRRPGVDLKEYFTKRWNPPKAFAVKVPEYRHLRERSGIWEDDEFSAMDAPPTLGPSSASTTEVLTNVELHSCLGETGRRRFLRTFSNKGTGTSAAPSTDNDLDRDTTHAPNDASSEDEDSSSSSTSSKPGFFVSWSRASLQRSVEAIGLKRTERAVPNSKKGMNVVLERLRMGGLVAVLEGMRMDREMVIGVAAGDD